MARMSGENRRKQIIEAAREAILERGLAQAATRDVTGKLGVGSGLLHHYFPSWLDLRAEAVRAAAVAEISEVQMATDELPGRDALEYLVAWIDDDEEMRHWRLWLNALDEAHRDPLLAEVLSKTIVQWHDLLTALVVKAADEKGTCEDPKGAAWRLAALMDGLASATLIPGGQITLEDAQKLMRQQIDMELGTPENNKQSS